MQVLNAYLDYMTTVGVLMGGEENATRTLMQNVIAFETELANVRAIDFMSDISVLCLLVLCSHYDEPFADNWSNEVEKDVCGRI